MASIDVIHTEHLDTKLLHEILDLLETMISSRNELIKWMKEFIKDITKQEIGVNTVKTVLTVVGVASAIRLFTRPLAPFAVAGLVASGFGLVTTIGDYTATKVQEGNLSGKVKTMKENNSKLSELIKKLEKEALQLQKDLNICKDATFSLLIDVPKATLSVFDITRGVPQIGKAFQGAGRASAMGAGQAARLGTTRVITTTSKALGGFGAVVGIADVIYSWSTKNPNRKSAEKLLPELEENLADLEQMKGKFSKLKRD